MSYTELSNVTRKVFPYIRKAYRNASNEKLNDWIYKGITPGTEPLKSKHIRRIILSVMRNPKADVPNMVSVIIHQKPWKEDAGSAAKLLYVVLMLLQYSHPSSGYSEIHKKIQKIKIYCDVNTKKIEFVEFAMVAETLATLILNKIKFHAKHPYVNGQFVADSTKFTSSLVRNLRKLLSFANLEAIKILNFVTTQDIPVLYVLCSPIIQEIVQMYRLLWAIDKDPADSSIFQDAEDVFDRASACHYLESFVSYPQEHEGRPTPLFTRVASTKSSLAGPKQM